MPEFWYIYLIPLVGIVAAVAYSQMARAQIAAAVATGRGPVLFHNAFAKNFDLQNQEFIVAFWQGVVYLGSDEGTQGGWQVLCPGSSQRMASTTEVALQCSWCLRLRAAYCWLNSKAVPIAW